MQHIPLTGTVQTQNISISKSKPGDVDHQGREGKGQG